MVKRPTINDVARRASVSKSTVSLVLRNSPLVRPGTRAGVHRAMAEIGYVYNRPAANLRSANAGLVGLVINDLRNPFFTEFATSVQMDLAARGYAVVVANTDEDPVLQAQVVSAMIEHGVSAFMISPVFGRDDTTFASLARAGTPTLQVLRHVAPEAGRFPFAAPDYPSGSRLATEHLTRSGARTVAFVGGIEDWSVTKERTAGWRAAMAAAGQEPLFLGGRPGRAFGREAAFRLTTLHPEVDGVVCFNDLVALGLLSGCAEIGRKVGHDLKIVGFDDIEECAQAWPALTSVRCDVAGFATQMADTLHRWIDKGIRPVAELRTPVELVIRASSGG
jgi:LacI family transcriptional regulator